MIFNEKVWVVLRPNYINGNLESIGICGTGFFIEPNKFITAHHLCDQSSFSSHKIWNNDRMLLLSPKGEREEIFLEQCNFNKDKDITYIKTNNKHSYLEIDDGVLNEEIYNIGYPTKDQSFLIGDNLTIKEQKKDEGKIIEIRENYSIEFSNGKINDKKVIIINYLSEEGFSGGPLFNKNNKVVGLLSNIDPIRKITNVVSSIEF